MKHRAVGDIVDDKKKVEKKSVSPAPASVASFTSDRELLQPAKSYLIEKSTEEMMQRTGQKKTVASHTVDSEYVSSLRQQKSSRFQDDSELLMDVKSYLNQEYAAEAQTKQEQNRVENKEHDFASYADLIKEQTSEIKGTVDGYVEEYKRIRIPTKPWDDSTSQMLLARHDALVSKKVTEEKTKTVKDTFKEDDALLRPINLKTWKYEGQGEEETTTTKTTKTVEVDEDEELLKPWVAEKKTLKVEEEVVEEESDGEYERKKLARQKRRKEAEQLQEETEELWTFSRKKKAFVDEPAKRREVDLEYEELMRPYESRKSSRRRASSPPLSSSEEEEDYYSSRSRRRERKSRSQYEEYESDYSTGVE